MLPGTDRRLWQLLPCRARGDEEPHLRPIEHRIALEERAEGLVRGSARNADDQRATVARQGLEPRRLVGVADLFRPHDGAEVHAPPVQPDRIGTHRPYPQAAEPDGPGLAVAR